MSNYLIFDGLQKMIKCWMNCKSCFLHVPPESESVVIEICLLVPKRQSDLFCCCYEKSYSSFLFWNLLFCFFVLGKPCVVFNSVVVCHFALVKLFDVCALKFFVVVCTYFFCFWKSCLWFLPLKSRFLIALLIFLLLFLLLKSLRNGKVCSCFRSWMLFLF